MSFLLVSLLFTVTFAQTLFVSFHKAEPNIYRYPIRNVESPTPFFTSTSGIHSLRGMVQVGPSIFVCNADAGTTGNILVSQDCGKSHSVFAQSGFSHPYGIAYGNSTFYVSNQDSDNVVSFNALTPNAYSVFASVHTPRGIAVHAASGQVYVAAEHDSAVHIFDKTGKKLPSLSLGFEPIGAYINGNTLYVSSKASGARSYSALSLKPLNTYSHSSLSHGTGMAVANEIFYILGQTNGVMCSFLEASGQYLGTLLNSFPDKVEQMIVGSC